MRLAGGPEGEPTIVSIVGAVLLPFIGTRDAALGLRLTCRELKQAVTDFPWEDMRTVIKGSIALWRACFPRAIGANVGQYNDFHVPFGRLTPVVDADFVHFVGLRALNMACCRQVTDAAFVHLRGIRKLKMRACNQDAITDAAFEHLKGVKELDMGFCNQDTITDAALAHLKGIQVLNMNSFWQVTDAAFAHLKGIQRLTMRDCDHAGITITDAAFEHLKGIKELNMERISEATITSSAFEHLKGIERLYMWDCTDAAIQAAQNAGLPVTLENQKPFSHVFIG